MPQKRKNPMYKVPELTVSLGTVLDLDAENSEYRYQIDNFNGFNLLCAENAIDQSPGYCKLYIVSGELKPDENADMSENGVRTYEEWHERSPELIAELETPDSMGYYQGRVTRIGYRSDKWKNPGTTDDYDHYFIERGGKAPRLYTDAPTIEQSSGAVIVGGDFVITDRGIA